MVTQESRAKGAAVSCHPQYGRIATPLLKVRERERGSVGWGERERGREGDRLLSFFAAGGQGSCCPTGSTSEPVSQRWPFSIEMLWLDQKKVDMEDSRQPLIQLVLHFTLFAFASSLIFGNAIICNLQRRVRLPTLLLSTRQLERF